ncbi:unnamed protein product [Vitrella brassicaformis CCMP3155]|uniref:Tyrosine-protein kinase ephrin type A/B receptor-like domain-containing protein n=4 Tax=Vitrella brassicaformis TaxID=1169539 RepID=A0A0G4EMN1_VITBC|nr:unnamed protein product [Vitrella brassicaformis CCMP3155]|eukprot:CEL98068.1 unnamed protein product [Vitrella brassicaformis CCMP3155]
MRMAAEDILTLVLLATYAAVPWLASAADESLVMRRLSSSDVTNWWLLESPAEDKTDMAARLKDPMLKQLNLSPSQDSPRPKRPVILIPGLCGSVLSVRNRKTDQVTQVWARMTSADQLLLAHAVGRFNSQTNRSEPLNPSEEVFSPVDDFGLYSIQRLFPEIRLGQSAEYLSTLIESLEASGYVRGETLFGFPFDWRQSVRNPRILKRLRTLIKTVGRGGRVDIVTHSMGGLLLKAFTITHKKEANEHIENWIAVNTPWLGGSTQTIYAALRGYTFGNPFITPSTIRAMLWGSPSIFELLPDFDHPWEHKPSLTVKNATTQIRLDTFDALYDFFWAHMRDCTVITPSTGVPERVGFDRQLWDYVMETKRFLRQHSYTPPAVAGDTAPGAQVSVDIEEETDAENFAAQISGHMRGSSETAGRTEAKPPEASTSPTRVHNESSRPPLSSNTSHLYTFNDHSMSAVRREGFAFFHLYSNSRDTPHSHTLDVGSNPLKTVADLNISPQEEVITARGDETVPLESLRAHGIGPEHVVREVELDEGGHQDVLHRPLLTAIVKEALGITCDWKGLWYSDTEGLFALDHLKNSRVEVHTVHSRLLLRGDISPDGQRVVGTVTWRGATKRRLTGASDDASSEAIVAAAASVGQEVSRPEMVGEGTFSWQMEGGCQAFTGSWTPHVGDRQEFTALRVTGKQCSHSQTRICTVENGLGLTECIHGFWVPGCRVRSCLPGYTVSDSQWASQQPPEGSHGGSSPVVNWSSLPFLDFAANAQPPPPPAGNDESTSGSADFPLPAKKEVACVPCTAGTYKHHYGIQGCMPCGFIPPHAIYTETAVQAAPCPTACDAGYYRTRSGHCRACPAGTYKDTVSDSPCKRCANANGPLWIPSHATAITTPQCPVDCLTGYELVQDGGVDRCVMNPLWFFLWVAGCLAALLSVTSLVRWMFVKCRAARSRALAARRVSGSSQQTRTGLASAKQDLEKDFTRGYAIPQRSNFRNRVESCLSTCLKRSARCCFPGGKYRHGKSSRRSAQHFIEEGRSSLLVRKPSKDMHAAPDGSYGVFLPMSHQHTKGPIPSGDGPSDASAPAPHSTPTTAAPEAPKPARDSNGDGRDEPKTPRQKSLQVRGSGYVGVATASSAHLHGYGEKDRARSSRSRIFSGRIS